MWKNIQKQLNSSESYVSMALGLAVVLLIGVLIFNYIQQKPSETTQTTDQTTSGQETPQPEKSETPGTFPKKHTVASGETLWSIAEKYYNSGYNWVDIQKANNLGNANAIEAGQELTIPQAKTITVAREVQQGQVSAASTEKKYTVGKGDYLWKIALEQYGNGYKWVDIARVNNLKNPNIIHAGNVLQLP